MPEQDTPGPKNPDQSLRGKLDKLSYLSAYKSMTRAEYDAQKKSASSFSPSLGPTPVDVLRSLSETEHLARTPIRYAESEVVTDAGNCIYMGSQEMKRNNIAAGQWIRIVNGSREFWAQVQPSVQRDNGSHEDEGAPFIRASGKVWKDLGVARGSAFQETIIPSQQDTRGKEIHLSEVKAEDDKVVRLQDPRPLRIKESSPNTTNKISLTTEQLAQFGVKPGEAINLRCGKARVERVVVQEAATKPSDNLQPSGWDISLTSQNKDILAALNGSSLRAKYDRESQELSFGPTMAFSFKEKLDGSGKRWSEQFEELHEMAKDYGVFVYIVDKDFSTQDKALLDQGLMWGYVYRGEHKYERVKVPIADVFQERGVPVKPEMRRLFDHAIIPEKAIIDTHYKELFSKNVIARDPELQANSPQAMPVEEDKPYLLDEFLTRNHEVILKPNSGGNGLGLMIVRKENDGTFSINSGATINTHDASYKQCASIDEVFRTIAARKAEFGVSSSKHYGEEYLAQEKIDSIPYRYRDPISGIPLTGIPEPRILVQRGMDGNLTIAGQAVKIQEPHIENGQRLTVGKTKIDFHIEDLRKVLHDLYGTRSQEVMNKIKDLSLRAFSAIEQNAEAEVGEMPIDFMLTPDGKPILLEANWQGQFGKEFTEFNRWGQTHKEVLRDGQYNIKTGQLRRALSQTGFVA